MGIRDTKNAIEGNSENPEELAQTQIAGEEEDAFDSPKTIMNQISNA
ncbi:MULTISPECIES: hypothetical protein [Streptomyces]|jgi:hypothetical protein|nr:MULTISPECIES: hypothetical protein [unclassified Streptomyces]UXY33005.1 hypothetical protein N8I87_42600 [Streptomyces sp. HUAS 15-9]